MTSLILALSTTTILAMGSIFSPFLKPESRSVEEGLEKYAKEDWVAAVEQFQKASEQDPDPQHQFNLGAAAYQGQNYPEALRAYAAAATSREIPPGRLAYDLGNALYRNQKMEDALKAYRQALREDPTNDDARFNYELTLRQLESQEQDQDQEQEQENKDQDQQNESSSDESQGDQSQAPPDSSGESQPSEPEEDSQGEEQQASEGEEQQEKGDKQNAAEGKETPPDQMLNAEEAMRLLNAVSPEERELIRARLKAGKRRAVEKDW